MPNDKKTIDSNSGVQANVGFDFQRNTCIFLFLEKYNVIKDRDYFIMLEHYDDIIFGFLNSDSELTEVTSYQAKKSSTIWTTNSIYEIIYKISNSGIEINKDSLLKTANYTKSQYFITNNTISLDYQCSVTNSKKKVHINETNESITYKSLDSDCQSNLKKGNKEFCFSSDQITHFNDLNFTFIDLGRNTKSQLELLTGKFKTVFGNSIIDHKAARDTFIFCLKEIESRYNQGDIPKLSDTNKRLESFEINKILNILTTRKLALDFAEKNLKKFVKS